MISKRESFLIISNRIMADMTFLVRLMSCEFPCLLVDKGSYTLTLHYEEL